MNTSPENKNVIKRTILGYGWKNSSEPMGHALGSYEVDYLQLETSERLAKKQMLEDGNTKAKKRIFRVVYEELEGE